MNALAIIIPAYKIDFLSQTLQSLSLQTAKDFTIYVGDDNSPYDIKEIVDRFANTLNIVYKRFEHNLGGESLIKQWERCIELSNEQWIWLFSDDDVLEPNCVELFYNSINANSQLYKFRTCIIDSDGNVLKNWRYDDINRYANCITTAQFLKNRIRCKGFRSFAVEYVFSREIYNKYKFVEFPLAWASDDATWILYSYNNNKQITCIDGFVKWRYSGLNLTSISKDDKVCHMKIDASLRYVKWLKAFLMHTDIKVKDSDLMYWLTIQIASLRFSVDYNRYKLIIQKSLLEVTKYHKIKNYLVINYYHLRNKISG